MAAHAAMLVTWVYVAAPAQTWSDLPVPLSSRSVEDRPSLMDRLLIRRSTHLVNITLAVWLGLAAGLPDGWVFWAGFLVGYAGLLGRLFLPRRYFIKGLYKRSFALAKALEKSTWFTAASYWRAVQAECHIMMGNLDTAKELLASIDRSGLSEVTRIALDIDTAFLHSRLQDPEKAFKLLDGLKPESIPWRLRPYYHVARAAAHLRKEDLPSVLEEVQKGLACQPPDPLRAACQSLQALALAEQNKDLDQALLLSQKSLRLLGEWNHGRPGLLLNHARVVLAVTGDPKDTMEILSEIIGREVELGPAGRAEFHYLMARCFHLCEMPDEARSHLDQASELPSSPSLPTRIAALGAELSRALTQESTTEGPHEDRSEGSLLDEVKK